MREGLSSSYLRGASPGSAESCQNVNWRTPSCATESVTGVQVEDAVRPSLITLRIGTYLNNESALCEERADRLKEGFCLGGGSAAVQTGYMDRRSGQDGLVLCGTNRPGFVRCRSKGRGDRAGRRRKATRFGRPPPLAKVSVADLFCTPRLLQLVHLADVRIGSSEPALYDFVKNHRLRFVDLEKLSGMHLYSD